MGFLVKLDTNGTNPKMVQKIIKDDLVDYIAMDIKTSFNTYDALVGVRLPLSDIRESKELIQTSSLDYEFRTTVIQGFHSMDDLESVMKACSGARKYTLQNFRNTNSLNPQFSSYTGFSTQDLFKFQKMAEQYVQQVQVLE